MADGLQLVTLERHGTQKWHRPRDFKFAAKTHVVPITLVELSAAVRSLPLGFVKSEGVTMLVALLSLRPNENLFVAPDGRWMGSYVPASIRSYPFRLGTTQGNGQLALVVDEGSGLLSSSAVGEGGTPFFAPEGGADPATKQMLETLIKARQSQEATMRAIAVLVQHELLEPWPLQIQDQSGPRPIAGVERISEAKLNALASDAFADLRNAGALAIAYGQLFSMGNISAFGTLAQVHAKAAAAPAQRMKVPAHSFVSEESESLNIDWNQFLKGN